jgi:hypothetical protein
MSEVFVFVYSNDNKIKSLSLEDSRNQDAQLKKDGWKHTATLNACVFISELFNNVPDSELRNSIKSIG